MADAPTLTRDQVLDGLAQIAALEHAYCVYYLRLHYALGGDPVEGGPAISDDIARAASRAFNNAVNDMFHLADVNAVLVRAGRDPVLDRATQVASAAGVPIDLDPMTIAQFAHFPAREKALAAALDGSCERIRLALASPTPPLDGQLLTQAQGAVERDHAGPIADLVDDLHDLAPADYLRVTGVAPAGAVDERLLALSDSMYGLLIGVLGDHFARVDDFTSPLRQHAVTAMRNLHDANRVLGLRGLLPPFTAP